MKHIAVYLRVSTAVQGTESQEPDLKRWLAAYGAEMPVQWYSDKLSGKSMDRPAFNAMSKAIDAGAVSTVLVWRLDRLGRTASGMVSLLEKWSKQKVNLVSMKEGLDLSTPGGRLLANVLASMASYETEIRAERVAAGQAAARAAGKRWGGSKPGRLLHVKPEQITVIQRMKAEGAKIDCIARAVSLSRPTIYKLLNGKAMDVKGIHHITASEA